MEKQKIYILAGLDREHRIIQLIRFNHENLGREEAGWFEHTSDWDPTLIVKLNSGEKIESASGYTEFEIVNYKPTKSISNDKDKFEEIELYIDNEENPEEPTKIRIKIDDISSITWSAN